MNCNVIVFFCDFGDIFFKWFTAKGFVTTERGGVGGSSKFKLIAPSLIGQVSLCKNIKRPLKQLSDSAQFETEFSNLAIA